MEIRKDYILDRYVYYASARKLRPKEFIQKKVIKKAGFDFFGVGNEHMTPPEIGRISKGDSWEIRWFPNKFPAVELKGSSKLKSKNNLLKYSDSYGNHEVIAETNDNRQLWDVSTSHLKDLLDVYKRRINVLSKEKQTKYVLIFKNHGLDAGTSIVHSHTQIVSTPIIPTTIEEKLRAVKKHGKNIYEKIIKLESKSNRKCFSNSTFSAFCPYASRFNFEVWIFPKKFIRSISDLNDKQTKDLADILHKILNKLKKLNIAYNFYIQNSPKGKNLHFHIEVTPRLAKWAGFELGSGFIINSIYPEEAAKFYRGK